MSISRLAQLAISFALTVVAPLAIGDRVLAQGGGTPPAVTSAPQGGTACANAPFTFAVAAVGTEPIAFQWRHDGVDIAGANANTLTLAAVQLADAGNYDCVLTNADGTVISDPAGLLVHEAASITAQPQSGAVTAPGAFTFTVAAAGTAPLSYQWRKDGVDLVGATAASLVLAAATDGDVGNYECVVTNDCGSVTSAAASLVVNHAPAITFSPDGGAVCGGGDVTFFVGASGTEPLSYQWRKDGVAIAGATDATLVLSAVQAGDTGSYDCLVANAFGNAASNPAALVVNTPPVITAEPQGGTANQGAAFTFAVAASGAEPITYQWRKDGIAIDGAVDPTLILTAVGAADVGSYDCEVTNDCGTVVSAAAVLAVRFPPVITSCPAGGAVCANGDATFVVTASGTAPLSYQWHKNGIAIAGATQAELVLASVGAGDAGNYECVVSNAAGSATSPMIALEVNLPARLLAQPVGGTINEGQSLTLAVGADGTNPILYQWRKDGVAIDGAIEASLVIAAASPADEGSYDCVVSNDCATVVSGAALVAVRVAPVITSSPQAAAPCAAGDATFAVAATGTEPLTYQWRKNGVDVPGATTASLLIHGVVTGDAGSYDCVVTNAAGTATSAAAVLDVHTSPAVTADPQGNAVNVGTAFTFTVAATGTEPLTYQWRKNGVDIAGATASSLALASAATQDEGSYDCVINNACGSATSAAATLSVRVPPAITSASPGAQVCEQVSFTFSVAATGTAPLTYQWRKDGVDVAGATANLLVLASVASTDSGSYDCVVTNAAGTATSTAAVLDVKSRPAIAAQPQGGVARLADTFTMSVQATGGAPLSYQWRKNGLILNGATAASLVLTGIASSAAGSYDCIVTNSCGSVTSTAALVTVSLAPWIAQQPQGGDVCLAADYTLSVTANGAPLLRYQWRKNGAVITGATTSSLLIHGALATDAGSYTCAVTNTYGTVISAAASVAINDVPVITSEPANVTACLGAPASLTVAATGRSLVYQWFHDGVAITGANAATYQIPAVLATDAGLYHCDVTNPCGVTASLEATLSIGQEANAVVNTYAAAAQPVQAVLTDVDSDGTPDVIVSSKFGTVQVFRSFLGALAAPSSIETGTALAGLTTGDFDGDGFADFAVAEPVLGAVAVFYGDGFGNFSAPLTLAVGGTPVAVAAVQLGSHQLHDLVVADSAGSLWRLVSNATPSNKLRAFGAANLLVAGTSFVDVRIADVTGDARLEIVALDQGAGAVRVISAHSQQEVQGSPFAASAGAVALALQDMNGDGKADVITAGPAGVTVHETPNFTANLVDATAAVSVVAGNFNGDRKADIAFATAAGATTMLYGYNAGRGPDSIVAGACLLPATSLAAGDLNPLGGWAGSPLNSLELVAVHSGNATVAVERFQVVSGVTPIPGSGCPGSTVLATANGSVVGGILRMRVSKATPSAVVVAVCQPNFPSDPVPVLQTLLGCKHVFNPGDMLFNLSAFTGGNGRAEIAIPVPNLPMFVGYEIRNQWMVFDGLGPMLGINLSDALLIRFGEL